MSREAFGDPPESQEPPDLCPVCGNDWHAEDCEFGKEVARRLKAERDAHKLAHDLENVAMMLRKCAHRLNVNGHEDLGADAVGLLRRLDLLGSPLRQAVPDSKPPNAELTGLGRSPAESTEEGTPAKGRLSDVLGLAPERDARWALAAKVARGRMAGGWVPVDADLVLALHARLTELAALEQQVAEGEELDKYRRGDGRREWSDACTWLYPGDRVVVLRA